MDNNKKSTSSAKNLVTSFVSMVVGAGLTLLTIQWQDEDLQYFLSTPSVFGDIVYQNLLIKNTGWNPAENVTIAIKNKIPPEDSVKETPSFDLHVNGGHELGGYERIRRNEVVTISFAYKEGPLVDSDLSIKSKRSIAKLASDETFVSPLLYLVIKVLSLIGVILSIFLLAKNYYDKHVLKQG